MDSSRASVATQDCQNLDNEQLSINAAPLPELQQYGTACPHLQLHHAEAGRAVPAGASFLTLESSISRPNNSFQSIGYGSPFLGTQGSHFHPLSSPTSWWEPSSGRSHSNPLLNMDRRSMHTEDSAGRKRRYQADWEIPKPQRFQHRQSMQISPRTNPVPSFTPLASSAYSTGINSHDMYGRPNQSLLLPSSWPSFDWNAFNDANTNHFISQSLQQAGMGIESQQAGRIYSPDPPQHPYQSEISRAHVKPISTWTEGERQSTAELETPQSPTRCTPAIEPRQTCNTQQYITNVPSNAKALPIFHAVSHEELRPSSNSHPSQKDTPTQPVAYQRVVESPNSLQRDTQAIQPSDIARRPSLYKIPPWPASLLASVPTSTTADEQRADSPQISGILSSTAIAKAAENPPAPQVKNQAHPPNICSPAKSITMSSPQSDDPTPSSDTDFQLPKAHAGRKKSPNLCVHLPPSFDCIKVSLTWI